MINTSEIHWTRKYRRPLGLTLFIVLLFILRERFGIRELLSVQYLKGWFQLHPVLAPLLFIALFTLGNLMQIPGFIFLVAAVLTLGKLYGGLLTFISAIISSTLAYMAIEFLGHRLLHQIRFKWAQRLLARLHQHPIAYTALLRLIFQTAPALNYTLSLSGISLRNYLLGTLLGLPVPLFFYVIFFDIILKQFR